jgi:hypothetical protein
MTLNRDDATRSRDLKSGSREGHPNHLGLDNKQQILGNMIHLELTTVALGDQKRQHLSRSGALTGQGFP